MARKASQNPSDQSAMPEPNGDMVAELQAMRQRLAECEEREAGYAQQTKQLRAQYRIADAASAVEDIRSFYRQVHTIVGTLMYAENLFIALYDAQSDLITWEYWVDTIDVDVPPPIRLQDHHGATGWVLRNGRTLADTDGSAQKAYDAGELELVGSDSDGIAIPLKNDDITVGVLLVQSYLKEFRYSVQDVETLAFAGQHISTALHRAQLLEETQQRNAELAIINSVQAGLASKLDMLEIEGWELAAYFQAARKVAGDFYDAFPLAGTGRIGIVLGDVCDKGVGAALFMTQFRSLLRAVSNMDRYGGWSVKAEPPTVDPAALLQQTITLVNNYIALTHEDSGMFATIFFGALDPQTGSLIYVNGGHEPPVILNAFGVKTRLKPTGPLVGLLPDMIYQAKEAVLEPGDGLLVFSDGVPDAQKAADEFFGEGPFPELLTALGGMDAVSQLATLNKEVFRFVEGMPQPDDITMLAVRHREP